MGKSLTDVAKQILSEGSYPSISPDQNGTFDRDAKLSTTAKASLRPGSGYKEERFSNPNATAPVGAAQEVGAAPTAPGEGDNVGAKASAGVKRDTTVKGAGTNSEKPKKQAEVMEEDAEVEGEVVAEEVEMTLEEAIEAYAAELAEQGLDEEAILEALEEEFGEYLSEEEELAEEYEVDMSEHVEALFAGEELSEEFKQKAITIFEAAVKQKVMEEVAMLEEAYAETLEEQVSEIQEELSSNVDDYLNYVVEQWVNENEVAIEAGLRSELTEEFISGLRQLFAEHYIDIPEEKISVVEEMAEKVVELEEKLNEEIDRNVALNKMLNESAQNEILFNACDGLTVTQAEKLKALAEGIDFTSANEYSQKINILKESYFAENVKTENVLDNNQVEAGDKGMIAEELQGPMAQYVRTLGKTLPK